MGFLSLLGEGTGSFFYHLFILLLAEAGLLVAYNLWKKAANARYMSLVTAFLGILGLKLILILTGLFIRAVGASQLAWLPPLERFGELVGLSLLLWGFTAPLQADSLRKSVLVLNTLLALMFYAVSVVYWQAALQSSSPADYNITFSAVVWEAWSALTGIVGIWCCFLSPAGELIPGIAFALTSIGHLMQMLVPHETPNIPLWVRWSTILAYPLFVVAVYTRLMDTLGRHPLSLRLPRGMSPEEAQGFIKFIETAQKGTISLDVSTVLENATLGVVRALQAEGGFVLLLDEENPGQVHLVTHPAFNGTPLKHRRLPLHRYPFLEKALNLTHQELVRDSSTLEQWVQVLRKRPLFLLLQPLITREETIGIVGVSSFSSAQTPAQWQKNLLRTLAREIRLAVEKARLYASLEKKVEDLAWQLHSKEKALAKLKELLTEEKTRRQEDSELVQDRILHLEKRVRELEDEKETLQEKLKAALKQAEEFKARSTAQAIELQGLRDQLKTLLTKTGPQPSEDLLDYLPCGLIMCDETGRITRGNRTAERILGWPSREFVGQPLSSFTDAPGWTGALAEVLEEKQEAATTLVELGAKIIRADIVRYEKGIIVTLLDLTDEIQAQRNKDRFLASLAADVRNPMTAIMGYTDLLLSESVGLIGDMQRRFLLRIKSNIERLNKLLNDLLNIAMVDSGQLRLRISPVDLNELVEEALLTVRAQSESSGVRIEVDIQKGIPAVELDFERMKYVLTTLLSNAVNCSPQDSTVRLEVKTESLSGKANYVRLMVTDAGGGIAPEDLGRVFTRFYRADQSLIRGLGEKGVGLALVKTLVELHGGRIWAESQMGKGTTFIVLLPIHQNRIIQRRQWEGENAD